MGSGAKKARQSVTQASNKDRKAYELAGDLYGVTGFFFLGKNEFAKDIVFASQNYQAIASPFQSLN